MGHHSIIFHLQFIRNLGQCADISQNGIQMLAHTLRIYLDNNNFFFLLRGKCAICSAECFVPAQIDYECSSNKEDGNTQLQPHHDRTEYMLVAITVHLTDNACHPQTSDRKPDDQHTYRQEYDIYLKLQQINSKQYGIRYPPIRYIDLHGTH